MKAIVQYISVVLFIMLYEAVLKFESVNNLLKYNDSNVGFVKRGVCFAFICKKKKRERLCVLTFKLHFAML